MSPNFSDRRDFEDADRGFVATLDPLVITNADGRPVWDISPYGFLDGECPDTVHPNLFRQAQLCLKNGLYNVTDGIYQIRGFDLSNMTLVEGETGVVVVDPLVSAECAAAGLALYREHRGERPVTAVIYTHPHIDHFGGVMGVLPTGAGDTPIVAPEGFLEHAVSENVYAGTAMLRRAAYQTGRNVEPGPQGQVCTGLGLRGSSGSIGLLAPTLDVTRTGQEEVLDGIRIVFQVTPGTEAPVEINFYFPDHRALCMAENATHNLHNVLTPRGALIRDAHAWSRYLDEAIELFAFQSDVVFASHHWPSWGTDRIVEYLREQRDLYGFLHDQTLRRMNQGQTGIEIAEDFELPPALDSAWHARGFYGSVSHNVKAVYQRYVGWFDGHPTSLWPHPRAAAASRYVDVIGGLDAVLTKAGGYVEAGDLRFAAELLTHAVFAEPDHAPAREALADVYQRLAFGAENSLWRNFYLNGRHELLHGVKTSPIQAAGSGMATALSVEQLLDTVAIRVDGLRAAGVALTIIWHFSDLDKTIRTTISNGVLIQTPDPATTTEADLTVTLTKADLLGALAGRGVEHLDHTGDPAAVKRLLDLTDDADPAFAIVTP